MDFKEIKGQRHYLYDSREEFYAISQSKSPVRRNWREGTDGEWVFTDDNFVCQILKCFKVGKNDCVRTVCGTFSRKNKKNKMLGEDGIAEHIYSFSGKKPDGKDKELTERHFLFAKYIATGDDIIEAYKKAFPRSKSDDYIKRTASSLIKTEIYKKWLKKRYRRY